LHASHPRVRRKKEKVSLDGKGRGISVRREDAEGKLTAQSWQVVCLEVVGRSHLPGCYLRRGKNKHRYNVLITGTRREKEMKLLAAKEPKRQTGHEGGVVAAVQSSLQKGKKRRGGSAGKWR